MIRRSWREITDRAVYLLVERGMTFEDVAKALCCSMTEVKHSMARVESGKYDNTDWRKRCAKNQTGTR